MTLLTFIQEARIPKNNCKKKMDTATDYAALRFILAKQKTEHMLLIKDPLQQSSFPFEWMQLLRTTRKKIFSLPPFSETTVTDYSCVVKLEYYNYIATTTQSNESVWILLLKLKVFLGYAMCC